MKQKWYGILTPVTEFQSESYISWITNSEYSAWEAFFMYPNIDKKSHGHYHTLPMEEAIRAYRAIGYKCVELDVQIKQYGI